MWSRKVNVSLVVAVFSLCVSTLSVAGSAVFSSSAQDAPGISTKLVRNLAPLNSFSILHADSRHHLRSFLPPRHLLSESHQFHTLSENSIDTSDAIGSHGFKQPYPDRIALEFDAFDRHFSFDMDLMHGLYEKGSYMSMRDADEKEVGRLEHELASYTKKISDTDWATATLGVDGTFHAVIYQEGEIYQADPVMVHQLELESHEMEQIQGQAQRNMVIFRHSDLIEQEKNHVCGAMGKPVQADQLVGDNLVSNFSPMQAASQLTNASIEFKGLNSRKLLQLNQATLAQFQNCYPGSGSPNRVSVGIAVDYGYYQIWGSDSAVRSRISSIITTANIVYMQQLNIFLTLNDVVIQTANGGPAWNGAPASIGGRCSGTINDVLQKFSQWKYDNYRTKNTIWHQLTACFPPPGTVGLAWIGVLCNQFYATGVSSHSSNGWLTVAHEIGHNFGAQHTFQAGQGNTGSIMDYCDGKLPCGSGPIQFHPQYSQSQMCGQIAAVKNTAGITPYCIGTYAAQCGNGIVEPGEACDDTSGCCVNCQLKSGAKCSGNTECCQSCQFAPTTTSCQSGQGYCGNGQCQSSICNSYSGISFCGLKSNNACRQQCKSASTGTCSDAYSTPNLNVADGLVCGANSVCSAGNCVSQGGGSTPAPTVTYTWEPGTFGACGCNGQQTRSNICRGSDGSSAAWEKCSGSQPSTSQSCAIPASCISYSWNAPSWSGCSVDCGGGTQTSPLVCTVQGTGQVVANSLCDASKTPATSQSCNTQACPTFWQYSNWGQCSASCGDNGLQYRTAKCYQTQNGQTFIVADSQCSNQQGLSQPCNRSPCATYKWVYGTWGACSAVCGGGTQANVAACVSSTGQTVDNSLCGGSSVITQACNTQACPNYQWQYTGDWSACSQSCGGGTQTRGLRCVDTVANQGTINTYCVLTPPATTQSCNTQACPTYQWTAGIWGACSASCGGGTQSRSVTCVNQANLQAVASSMCTGALPTAQQACNVQACATQSSYKYWVGGWSTCSSLCNGMQVRYVGCVPQNSFTPVATSLCPSPRPASTQACSYGAACYDQSALPNPYNTSWVVSEWGPCSSICGGGFRNRTLTCQKSGSVVEDSQCPQPGPVVPLTEVCGDFSCPVFWWTGEFDACTATCGGGMKTRPVECRLATAPDGPAVSEELCTSTKPNPHATCGSNPCPRFVPGDWSSCSSPCGSGVQTRALTCMSYDNQTLADADCANAPLLPTQQVCSNFPCPHWHREDWAECDKPCGGGHQTRPLVCRMPHDTIWLGTAATNASLCPEVGVGDVGDGAGLPGVPSGRPPSIQSCNIEQCPAYYWQVVKNGVCSATCGGGIAQGTVKCMNGADGVTEVDGGLCQQIKPTGIYNCNPQPCPSYNWFAYSKWSNCSVFCGTGVQTRDIKCRNMHPISNLPLQFDVVDDQNCIDAATNKANPPIASQPCYPKEDVCDGGIEGELNGVCSADQGECVCRLGYGGRDCSIPPSIMDVETNAIYYSQGVPIKEYLEVSWVSTGDLPHVSILLMKNGDPLWPFASYLAQQIINTNNFVWQVGSNLPDLAMGDGYTVRVWFGDNLYADSDPFSIADPCAYKYCGDKGMCLNGTCQCLPGFSGVACAIGPCERAQCDRVHSSCNNDDYIMQLANSSTFATCECLDGWTGAQCKTPPACASKTCKNGADLLNVIVHADGSTNAPEECGTCSCLNRWAGDDCGTCTLTCQNGGVPDSTCSECQCQPGFFGSTCDCRYYSLNLPLRLSDTSFLQNPVSEARFQRTLANDLALAGGAATGVVVEVVVNDTWLDAASSDVVAQVFFSLECVISSAYEGGSLEGLMGLSSTIGPDISNGASNRFAAGLSGTARDAIEVAAAHYGSGKYAQAQTSADAVSDLILPGQQGSLSLAFSLLAAAFANSDSLIYHGVVTANINKKSQIIAEDPTHTDTLPKVAMASDPFTTGRRRGYPGPGNLSSGSVVGLVVGVIIAAVIAAAGISFWWWKRAKKQMVSQEMELESRVLRELKSDKHQNAYEPQTPFTPATPATATALVDPMRASAYRPPVTTEVIDRENDSRRSTIDRGDNDRRPLVKTSEPEKFKYTSAYDRNPR